MAGKIRTELKQKKPSQNSKKLSQTKPNRNWSVWTDFYSKITEPKQVGLNWFRFSFGFFFKKNQFGYFFFLIKTEPNRIKNNHPCWKVQKDGSILNPYSPGNHCWSNIHIIFNSLYMMFEYAILSYKNSKYLFNEFF